MGPGVGPACRPPAAWGHGLGAANPAPSRVPRGEPGAPALTQTVFRPAEGAVVDLAALSAIARAPSDALAAALAPRMLDRGGIVLEGLELLGEWATPSPPGTRRPDPLLPHARVSAGVALVAGPDGPLVLRLEAEQPVRWPTAAGAAVRGVLVLIAGLEPGLGPGRLRVARDDLTPQLGFVRPDQVDEVGMLRLAVAIGNGRDWATDLSRVWQPEHDAVQVLIRRLDAIEQIVWRAEPEGSVWDRQVLGRNWVRYQTTAAAAVQAARMQLTVHALTTRERVRLLGGLRAQLAGSVERAATELIQLLGPVDLESPYRSAHREAP